MDRGPALPRPLWVRGGHGRRRGVASLALGMPGGARALSVPRGRSRDIWPSPASSARRSKLLGIAPGEICPDAALVALAYSVAGDHVGAIATKLLAYFSPNMSPSKWESSLRHRLAQSWRVGFDRRPHELLSRER